MEQIHFAVACSEAGILWKDTCEFLHLNTEQTSCQHHKADKRKAKKRGLQKEVGRTAESTVCLEVGTWSCWLHINGHEIQTSQLWHINTFRQLKKHQLVWADRHRTNLTNQQKYLQKWKLNPKSPLRLIDMCSGKLRVVCAWRDWKECKKITCFSWQMDPNTVWHLSSRMRIGYPWCG